MDLNNFFLFDDAALDFCNSISNDGADSNGTSPLDALSSCDETTLYHSLSEDSGLDTIPYFSDGGDSMMSKSPPLNCGNDASQVLTPLTAPAVPTFRYIVSPGTPEIIDALAQAVPSNQFKAEVTSMDTISSELAVDDASSDAVPYSNKSSTGKIELKIMTQPSRNHRARYRTEGSRGAVKDRSGRSFPVVKLVGYNKTPVKLRCYIGHDKRQGEPHLFYQVSKIVGKHVTACEVTKIEGIKVVEIDLLPSSNMQATINCLGIVKERNFDVQRKATNLRKKHLYNEEDKAKNGMERRSTTCTLVFGCQIPDANEILQIVSDPINCAQLLGCPEVHKISTTRADVKGGEEMFIIGKNFTRDTKLTWENTCGWNQTTEPEAEFLNQNHLICKVPPFAGVTDTTTDQIDVTFKIKCGSKYSEPYIFSYSMPTELANWALKI